MKAFKITLLLIVLLLIGTVGVVAYLVNNLDAIVEDTVESVGTRVTQTEVVLNSADIQLRQGRGELNGLTVANPREFQAPNALVVDQLALEIEPTSVVGDVIVIRDVLVEDLAVTVEQQGLTTNIQALLDAIKEAAGPEEPPPEGGEPVRMMVEKIRFAGGSIALITEQQGEHSTDLPGFELANIGTREEGLTPPELAKAVLGPLLAQVRDAAQKRLEQRLRQEAEGRLKGKVREELGDDAEKKLRDLKGLLE